MSKKKRKLTSEQLKADLDAHQQITKGPQPKLTISIFQRYGLSENVLHQARQWRSSMWRKGRGWDA